MLSRKENSIWLNYERAKSKRSARFSVRQDDVLIPIRAFGARYSYLESAIVYLRDQLKMHNNECARLLAKSPQTISIAYNRTRSK
jgi:hypothetical protein